MELEDLLWSKTSKNLNHTKHKMQKSLYKMQNTNNSSNI